MPPAGRRTADFGGRRRVRACEKHGGHGPSQSLSLTHLASDMVATSTPKQCGRGSVHRKWRLAGLKARTVPSEQPQKMKWSVTERQVACEVCARTRTHPRAHTHTQKNTNTEMKCICLAGEDGRTVGTSWFSGHGTTRMFGDSGSSFCGG